MGILLCGLRVTYFSNYLILGFGGGGRIGRHCRLAAWSDRQQIRIPNWYTGCPRRNVKYFGRVFLMLNYTDITQNTYIQSWTVTELMTIEKCGLLWYPRTVRRPWRNIHPLRKPGKDFFMQWPWRKVYNTVALTSQDKERSGGLCKVLRSLRRAKTWMREFL